MRDRNALAVGAAIGIGAALSIAAVALADDEDNDRILRGDRGEYIEVFKKDSSGGEKNYLYTITEFEDAWGRQCTVVTGDSETTIALDCDKPQG
jgi:hypothetical protein